MTHKPIHIALTPEWACAQAMLEPDSGIFSVGGLASRIAASENSADDNLRKDPEANAIAENVTAADRESAGKIAI